MGHGPIVIPGCVQPYLWRGAAEGVMQMLLARELARTLGGLAWIWGITSFAGSKSIGLYGTDAQKKQFLPLIATGQLKAAIAFTEPAGGTDLLGAMATTAERGDGGWILNGEKIWSSSVHVADYLLVITRSDKNAEKKHQGLTLFWVPTKSEGVKITPLSKLGMCSMGSCSVHFEDVFVPDDLVLGEPHKAWYMLLPTLNNERIMVGAFCLGVIDGVLEDAVDYMKQHQAFGGIIGRFQSLQHYVANIATMQKTTELMLHFCADKQSKGENIGLEANMLKLLASENANKAADLGFVDKGYPEFDWGESDETEIRFPDFVVAGRDAPPVLEFVEHALDQVAPFVFGTVVRGRIAPVDLGGDHRFDTGRLDLLAYRIGIVASIGQEGFDPVGYHAEQRCEALHVVCLPGCQHEAEREASGVAPCVELGEAASRSAKRLGLLSPLLCRRHNDVPGPLCCRSCRLPCRAPPIRSASRAWHRTRRS